MSSMENWRRKRNPGAFVSAEEDLEESSWVGMQAAPAFHPAKSKSRQKGVTDPPELTQYQ
jgi:hypothetical protein